MKQYIEAGTIARLNDLLAMFFKANSFADNLAYSLDCELQCQLASEIYHKRFAHLFPGDELADALSDVIVKVNGRPLRKSFNGDDYLYENIAIAFQDNVTMVTGIYEMIATLIKDLDAEPGNKFIIVKLEDMLAFVQPLLKQSYIWEEKAENYWNANDVDGFNIHFKDFTTLV